MESISSSAMSRSVSAAVATKTMVFTEKKERDESSTSQTRDKTYSLTKRHLSIATRLSKLHLNVPCSERGRDFSSAAFLLSQHMTNTSAPTSVRVNLLHRGLRHDLRADACACEAGVWNEKLLFLPSPFQLMACDAIYQSAQILAFKCWIERHRRRARLLRRRRHQKHRHGGSVTQNRKGTSNVVKPSKMRSFGGAIRHSRVHERCENLYLRRRRLLLLDCRTSLETVSTESSVSSWSKKRDPDIMGVSARGLRNNGQTCFLNCILQALASCANFIQYLEGIVFVMVLHHECLERTESFSDEMEDDDEHEGGKRHIDGKQLLSDRLLEILLSIGGTSASRSALKAVPSPVESRCSPGCPDSSPIDPKKILSVVGKRHKQFRNNAAREQQDAEELLQGLLSVVVDEAEMSDMLQLKPAYRYPKNDLLEDELQVQEHYGDAYDCLTITNHGSSLGVLADLSEEEDSFSEENEDLSLDIDSDCGEDDQSSVSLGSLSLLSILREMERVDKRKRKDKQNRRRRRSERPTGRGSEIHVTTPVGSVGPTDGTVKGSTEVVVPLCGTGRDFAVAGTDRFSEFDMKRSFVYQAGGSMGMEDEEKKMELSCDGSAGNNSWNNELFTSAMVSVSAEVEPCCGGPQTGHSDDSFGSRKGAATETTLDEHHHQTDETPLGFVASTTPSKPSAATDISTAKSIKTSTEGLTRTPLISSLDGSSSSQLMRMLTSLTTTSPTPLTGWLGSCLQCCSCHHVRPIHNAPFVDIPIVPQAVTNFMAHQGTGIHNRTGVSSSSPTSFLPGCTLQQCLTSFTCVERVTDVECMNCTIRSELSSLSEEIEILSGAVESRARRGLDAAELRQELGLHQARETVLLSIDPDDAPATLPADLDLRPTRTDAFKCLLLTRLPPVLCLHVQRRYYDIASDRMAKAMQHVSFPEVLDMSSYCAYSGSRMRVGGTEDEHIDKESCWAGRGGRGGKHCQRVGQANGQQLGGSFVHGDASTLGGKIPYRLMSVVEHQGNAHGGHYQTYRRIISGEPQLEGRWVRVSDEKVSVVGWDDVRLCQAYMLFYEAM